MPEIESPSAEQPHETPDENYQLTPQPLDPHTGRAALTVIFFAVAAGVATLMAGHAANEAILEQTRASNRWAYYQARSTRAAVLNSKLDLMEVLGKAPGGSKATAADREKWSQDLLKLKEYKEEMEKTKKEAEEREEAADVFMAHQVILARAATFFQIAIALCSMALLSRRRSIWIAGMVLGGLGAVFFLGSVL